jgi:hypothetical protein
LNRRRFDGFNFPENCMNNKSVIVRFLIAFLALTFAQVSFAQSNDAQKQADAKAQARQKAMSGPPDATAEFDAKQLRLIAGGAKGKGVLHFKGKDYPFTMSGVTVGGVGYTEAHGTANVYFLKNDRGFSRAPIKASVPAPRPDVGKGGQQFSEHERSGHHHQVEG